ncbi:ATP-binding protein [Pontibacillus salicampi]|uniref:histidine kinase n=1 Tax=Pontibacillus salicampi TaxID=1449801 RepID=A0ABV6LSV1_9BACI
MPNFFKQSIRRQFLFIMMFVFLLAFVGMMIILLVESQMKASYVEKREQVSKEVELLENLEEQYNQMVLRARGYLAFGNEGEWEKSVQAHDQLVTDILAYKNLSLTNEESEMITNLESYVNRYWDELLPQAVTHMENGEYEDIQALSFTSEGTDKVNSLFQTLHTLVEEKEQDLLRSHDDFMSTFDLLTVFMILFIAVLFTLLSLATKKLSRDIAMPLFELSATAERLAKEEQVSIPKFDRKDEIGTLAHSFENMANTIQEREADLQAHVEELQAQQDELTDQQERLESSYQEINTLNMAINEAAIVAISDNKGIFTFVNDKYCELSKYKKEELEGLPYTIILSGEHEDAFYDSLLTTLRSGRIWKGEIRNRAKDGSIYWTDTTIVPYLDENGEIEQFINIQFDITIIKHAEAELKDMLEESNRTKLMLEDYNEFNHVLSTTLEKEDMMEAVMYKLSSIFHYEKGILVDLNEYEYTCIGIGEEAARQYVQHIDTHVLVRLQDIKELYVTKREALEGERGYHDSPLYSYDVTAPIFNSDGNIMAVFSCTRVGMEFTEDELDELDGLLNQVALSLGKILLYDQTENDRQLNQTIIDNVNEGIQFVDKSGDLVQYNEKMCEFLHITSEEAFSSASFEQWKEVFLRRIGDHEALSAFFEETIFSSEATGSILQYEIEYPNKRIMEVYAERIVHNQHQLGTLLVHRDITSQYEVDQMKSELVSTVSHELRTPLASVLGYTELMLKRNLSEEKQKRYIDTIHKEAKRLTNLINDFLDLQRMESGRQSYTVEELNVIDLAKEVMEGFKIHNPTHYFEVQHRMERAVISGDREKLVQVFTNLIGNAVKFSPEGGSVIVSITTSEEEVVVHIADEGLGIPDSEMTKLFKKFHRIDNTDRRKIGGTGLGLAICKEIIEAHEGAITVHSEIGVGSVFTFRLPSAPGKRQQDGSSKHPLYSGFPLLMVVEDDESLASLLSEELNGAGFNVLSFSTAEAALDSLQQHEPDAFVIDLMLGKGMNGWELIEELKTREDTKDTPIFISTALDEEEKGEQWNVNHYLTKPYPPNKLATIILQTLITNDKKGQIMIADRDLKA